MQTKEKYPDSEIFNEVESDSSKISSNEMDEILNNENQIKTKASKLNIDRFSKLIKQLSLSFQMLRDYRTKGYTHFPWRTVALLVAAILYFINPFDLIPDFIPFLGYTDDAIAFAAVFQSIRTDLQDYCKWKGYDSEEYF